VCKGRYGLTALLAFACAHRPDLGHYISRRVKAAPAGVLSCYASASYGLSDTLVDVNMQFEPMWLVLDSSRDAADSSYATAYLIFQQRRDRSIVGRWRRIGDSLEVQELTSFPNGSWTLGDHGDSLVCRGFMIHDVGQRDSSGAFVPGRSEWRARAERVPCGTIP